MVKKIMQSVKEGYLFTRLLRHYYYPALMVFTMDRVRDRGEEKENCIV